MPQIRTWFRGEGAGVLPARLGAWTHDLGEGVYFTDDEQVAWMYAKLRAPGYPQYRVWQVDLEPSSLGRVLDLTADTRWDMFMNEPMFPELKRTDIPRTRMGLYRIKNKMYGKFFEEFLQRNNIDINSYDAVIGPEYQRGGKQLCILHKNGLPSRLSARIRSLLIPEEWAARLAKVTSRWGKLTLVKAVGGVIVDVVIMVVLAYIANRLMESIEDSVVSTQMGTLETELENFRNARQIMVLDNLVAGEHAYVTASILISKPQMIVDGEGIAPPQQHSSLPLVKLESLAISSRNLSDAKPKTDSETVVGITYYTVEFTCSVELTASADEVQIYRDVQEELAWYEAASKNKDLPDSDRASLLKTRDAVQDWIDKTYGKFDEFKPTRHLWTKDGYARFVGSGR